MRKIILIVRDGWGYTKERKGNAAAQANLPNNSRYEKECPWALLKCSGNAVGLPEGTQGGSEPGHLTMGAGRIVCQPFEDINRKIKSGEFFKNKALMLAIENCKKKGSSLHLMGLFSDQGVHGTTEHMYALMELAKRNGLKKVFVHAFLDGRDSPEKSAEEYLKEFAKRSKKIGVGKIASMIGRFYAMDRDNNWDRTKKAYFLLTQGLGTEETDPLKAIKKAYIRGEKSLHEGRAGDTTDYYIRPIVIVDKDDDPLAIIKDKDSVIFWNFRSDRARQITEAITGKHFNRFKRAHRLKICYICMSEYNTEFNLPSAFQQLKVKDNLGDELSSKGIKQLRIAETEKYAHVTFFFNSQVEKPGKGEDRMMVPSPKVPSYDKKPEMSAFKITKKLVPEIKKGKYGFILVNYANGDLVGHSADMTAGIKACEVVDHCVGRVVEAALSNGYTCLITGDHGNIECMFYPNGEPNPSHGTNPVPFFLISREKELMQAKLREGCGLQDVAPTILGVMGIKKPKEMTGKSLIKS